MLKRKDYPKQLIIGDEIYKIKFVRKMKDQPDNVVGDCCPSEKLIRILMGQSRDDTFKTYLHEIMHAFEFEADLDIKHSYIYKLEQFLFDFLTTNLKSFAGGQKRYAKARIK